MTQQVDADTTSDDSVPPELEVKEYTYDDWMASTGVPIHRGYFIRDLRTVELGWWEERGCESAFIQLVGQEGVTSAMVQEIPPGETLPPLKFALDELVYVLQGHGVTTVWPGTTAPGRASNGSRGACSRSRTTTTTP